MYQFERSILLERQREGSALAKAKGKFTGRKATIDTQRILDTLNAGNSIRKTAELCGVSMSSVQRAKKAAWSRLEKIQNHKLDKTEDLEMNAGYIKLLLDDSEVAAFVEDFNKLKGWGRLALRREFDWYRDACGGVGERPSKLRRDMERIWDPIGNVGERPSL